MFSSRLKLPESTHVLTLREQFEIRLAALSSYRCLLANQWSAEMRCPPRLLHRVQLCGQALIGVLRCDQKPCLHIHSSATADSVHGDAASGTFSTRKCLISEFKSNESMQLCDGPGDRRAPEWLDCFAFHSKPSQRAIRCCEFAELTRKTSSLLTSFAHRVDSHDQWLLLHMAGLEDERAKDIHRERRDPGQFEQRRDR